MSEEGAPRAAFFDMDGTVLDSNIVRFYLWYVKDGLSGIARAARMAGLYASVPAFLITDRVSRSALNRFFYSSYRGVSREHFAAWNRDAFDRIARPRLFPGAVEEIAALRRGAMRIVLVTGATREVATPIAEHLGADHVIAAELEAVDGRFTGKMLTRPVGDEEKASQIRAYAAAEGIDLASSASYADNYADLPMLEATGHPVAVNPDRRLAREAARRVWPVRVWKMAGANGSGT